MTEHDAAVREARELLIRMDGTVRHARKAGLDDPEEAALYMRAGGAVDCVISRHLGIDQRRVVDVIGSAGKKLKEWDRAYARDTLRAVGNKPGHDPRMIEQPHRDGTVSPEELRQDAPDQGEKIRVHANVNPQIEQLTAPLRRALRTAAGV